MGIAMTEPTWTEEELNKFDRLTMMAGSRNQVTRISGRLEVNAFIAEHGKEKCDAMFAEIQRREAAKKRRRK